LVRPAQGWNYQYVTTSPGEMLAEEFLKPLGLSQNRLAMNIHVPTTRIGEIVRGKRAITPDTALRLARFSITVRSSGSIFSRCTTSQKPDLR